MLRRHCWKVVISPAMTHLPITNMSKLDQPVCRAQQGRAQHGRGRLTWKPEHCRS